MKREEYKVDNIDVIHEEYTFDDTAHDNRYLSKMDEPKAKFFKGDETHTTATVQINRNLANRKFMFPIMIGSCILLGLLSISSPIFLVFTIFWTYMLIRYIIQEIKNKDYYDQVDPTEEESVAAMKQAFKIVAETTKKDISNYVKEKSNNDK